MPSTEKPCEKAISTTRFYLLKKTLDTMADDN